MRIAESYSVPDSLVNDRVQLLTYRVTHLYVVRLICGRRANARSP